MVGTHSNEWKFEKSPPTHTFDYLTRPFRHVVSPRCKKSASVICSVPHSNAFTKNYCLLAIEAVNHKSVFAMISAFQKDINIQINPSCFAVLLRRNHIWVFIKCLIENPAFDSQTKECCGPCRFQQCLELHI